MVRLPSLFGSRMVLQRESDIRVWGYAGAEEELRVDFRGVQRKTRADRSGIWKIVLGSHSAGGPYTMTVAGEQNSVQLQDILLGDVWLASGQSNMEAPLVAHESWWRGVRDADQELAAANYSQMRILCIDHMAAPRPLADAAVASGWLPVTAESVKLFSAVGYMFGRALHLRYQIPIGIIQATWGSLAEAWMSTRALSQFPEFALDMKALEQVTEDSRRKYEEHVLRKTRWYEQHHGEDRGMQGDSPVWADPVFDTSGWATVSLPQTLCSCETQLNGFSGVGWFRRNFTVPSECELEDVWLRLARVEVDDTTYINGHKIGETRGESYPSRRYFVPSKYLRAGTNTIAIRVVGSHQPEASCAGIFRITGQDVGIEGDDSFTSLAGEWTFQPGPDLTEFPVADAVTIASRARTSTPTALFNGMISPLTRCRIKGVIWYQGESNALDNRAAQYRRLFPALIEDWRNHWGYQFPFLFVQLPGFGCNQTQSAEYEWADLREAQSMAQSIPGTGMAVTIDIGEETDIHPRNKQDVARRLAFIAARIAYGEEQIVSSGPIYQSLKSEMGQIRLRFSGIGSGLLIKDRYGYIRGFEISEADGRFRWAQARQEGADIVVFSEAIRNPVAVRYGWLNTPDGNVFNQEGLPLAPFRTDRPRIVGSRAESTTSYTCR
jgi:sialate O-acetylesterase